MLRQFLLSIITGYVLFDKNGQKMFSDMSKKIASFLTENKEENKDEIQRNNNEIPRQFNQRTDGRIDTDNK